MEYAKFATTLRPTDFYQTDHLLPNLLPAELWDKTVKYWLKNLVLP